MAKKKQELSSEELLEQALVREEDWPYQVPGNWVWTRFDKLKESESGFFDGDWILSQNMDIKGEVRLIQLSDIGIGIFLDKSSKHINSEKFEELGCKEICEGDILISRMADPIVRSFIFPKLAYKCITVVDIAVLRCNTTIVDRKFINFLCNTPWFTNFAMNISRGTTRVRITRKNLGELPIPLPPLAEQQRIVDRIESLFDKLDQAKDLIQEALDSFETRKAAILHQAFTGQLTKKWREAHGVGMESWEEKTIGDIADVKGGKRLPKGNNLVNENTGYPYIKAGDLKNGTVLLEKMQYLTPEIYEKIKNYTVSTGEVYITIVGACIGDVGVIPESINGANLTENAAKITNISCDSKYLGIMMSSNIVQRQIKTRIASATLGKLSLQNIKLLEIIMPCLAEQQEIVRILDVLFAKEQNAKDLCDLIDQIEAMKKTILGQAFRGELGTNDPAEDSAVALLKNCLTVK